MNYSILETELHEHGFPSLIDTKLNIATVIDSDDLEDGWTRFDPTSHPFYGFDRASAQSFYSPTIPFPSDGEMEARARERQLRAQANELVKLDPEFIRLDEIYGQKMEEYHQAQSEVSGYQRQAEEKIYQKLLKNKAFI